MSLDSLLPIAPARTRALLLPLGPVRSGQFTSFVDRLREEHVIYLRDVTADARPNRNMFSPLAFPDGAIFYELATHMPSPSHLALAPFDIFREPLVVLAIADGRELDRTSFGKRQSMNGAGLSLRERNIRTLYQELEDLRDMYPKALVHRVLLFEYDTTGHDDIPMPEGIVAIPPAERCKRTTIKSVMCDVSSLLLAEMTTLAKSMEALSFIESPSRSSPSQPLNGSSWTDDANHQRRNSQFSLPSISRSSSVGGIGDRSHVRMSMPPVPFKSSAISSSSSTPGRPSTPVRSGLSNPPATFEEMERYSATSPPTPDGMGSLRRPDTAEGDRSQSQDRVSVQGFGSGGINDRWRTKGRGRVGIVIGSLYVLAGRWSDALRELAEGAAIARSINDHIWHGKALELIITTLFLLGWSGLEFQVPLICLPPYEKGSTGEAALREAEALDPNQPRHLRNLQVILPEILERIIGLYSRISSENLPPLPLSETIIRFCKMLSAVHIAGGKLDRAALDLIVLGKLPGKPLSTSPRLTVTPNRQFITTLLFRAFPSSSAELLTTVDRISLLSGIASVLGPLGYQRKKAMVVRELISVLIGGLVEARTRGAAEAGIHPAAGLVALTSAGAQSNGSIALELQEADIEQGIEAFLGALCKSYGIVSYDPAVIDYAESSGMESNEEAIARIRRQVGARFFGFPSVKLNILRACINFSEALPDFQGVLKFSSDLLRTAGSGVAPGARREDASPVISREEQTRLISNIVKTHGLVQRLGLRGLEADYWDEFLIRGVSLDPLPPGRVVVPHAKSVLSGPAAVRTSQDVNPFIYNPFLKSPDKSVVEHTLVVGEAATFRVTLQNPFEIDVDIESLRLDSEGVEFESAIENTIVGPYRTQVLKVSGMPRKAGSLKITGAIVRIRGCRERRFPIFSQPWMPQREMKIKSVGMASLEASVSGGGSLLPPLPAAYVSLNAITEQPLVSVKSTSLPQSCVMILEGERQVFSITLQNHSKTVPVDFLRFSFEDSTQAPLQAALSNRDLSPIELYEHELVLMKKQALRLRNKDATKRSIAPGALATFEFEIYGKPGLTTALIQVDYSYIGVPLEEIVDQFYTRRVSAPLTVTVNASVELARMEILPLHGPVPRPLWTRVGKSLEDNADNDEDDASSSVSTSPDDLLTPDKFCLLSLDLINAWPSNMIARLEGEDGIAVEEFILPGHTTRIIIPVRRIYLDNPHASIPALNPNRNRQFVVSTSKITPDGERAVREGFWYREKLLEGLSASWKMISGLTRTGIVELRSMRLNPRMIEAIKIEEVDVSITLEDPVASTPLPSPSEGVDHTVPIDTFLQARVRITNRTNTTIQPLLRLLPSLRHRAPNVALDFARKFAWNGTLQHVLPALAAQSTIETVLGITALCRGQFDIAASVEEAVVPKEDKPPAAKKDGEVRGRERSDTQTLMDLALGGRERRIWHSRRACVVSVVDTV